MNSKSKKLVVASAAIVAFLVFFSTVQCGLSSPITTPIAVKMDNSSGVNLASETLKENVPSILIVDYNSPAYYLAIWRAYGGVIWVGHGSLEGVQTQQGLLTWRTLAGEVEATPSKDMVLVCYSSAILGYTPVSNVPVSFNREIDAKLGALITSYALTGNKATLVEAFQQSIGLLSGKVQPAPLLASGEYYIGVGYLTNYEFASFVSSAAWWLFMAVAPELSAFWDNVIASRVVKAIYSDILSGLWTIIWAFGMFLSGIYSITDFLWATATIFAGAIIDLVKALDLWMILLIAGFWIVLTIASMGTAQVAYIVAALLLGINFAMGPLRQLFYDCNEYDGSPSTGGGGGCPYLYVYDGSQYVNEGLLDIHTGYTGTDLVTSHLLANSPQAVNGKYLLRLVEYPDTISHIDQVSLYATLKDGRTVRLPLVRAVHSEYGNVLPELLRSDDKRVDELGASFNGGVSQSIDLEFLAPRHLQVESLTFVIEGYNAIVK